MSRSLDTSLLVRLCVNDVPKQVAAVNALLDTNEVFSVADIAILETVYVLLTLYNMPRHMVADTLRALINQPSLACNQAVLSVTLDHFEKYPALSFVDCYLTQQTIASKAAPLLTFDKKLAKQLQYAELLPS